MHEIMDLGGGGLANLARVGIRIIRLVAADREDDRGARIAGDRDARRPRFRIEDADPREQLVERQALGVARWRRHPPGIALRPADDLILECERRAGE